MNPPSGLQGETPLAGAENTWGDSTCPLLPVPQSGKNEWMRQKGNTDPRKQIAFMKIIYLAFFFFSFAWGQDWLCLQNLVTF